MDCNHALDFIPDLDDWTQRPYENPYDPLEDIRQEHETWLAELEGLAVEAIAANNWDAFYAHVVDFQNLHDLSDDDRRDASADELDTRSADALSTDFNR